MSIQLPSEVVQLLQFIGINWPDIDEDKVREASQHVGTFALNVQSTHDSATAALQQAGQHYQGGGYDALIATWAQKSQDHMNELVQACRVVAAALEAAAEAIFGMKMAAIAELVVLAAAFVADQAAAVATAGVAEVALPLIEAAAEKCVQFLEQQIIQYVIGQVIEAAVQPLIAVVDKAIDGLVYSALSSALGGPAPSGAAVTGFRMEPEAFKAQAQALLDHAQVMAGHAETLQSTLSVMTFE